MTRLEQSKRTAAYKRLGDHCARELQRERKAQRKANSG